ncbi:hypothetical protein JST97_23255 [bacterium]|nr:hypothetical protein [bacterium]
MTPLPLPKRGLECRPQDGKLLVYDPSQQKSFELPPPIYRVLGFCNQNLTLEEAVLHICQETQQSPELSHLSLALGLDYLKQVRLLASQ